MSSGANGFSFVIVGIVMAVLGLLTWKKQTVSILHSYHYKKVREEDIPAYTRQMGIGQLIIGIGLCLTGLIRFKTGTFISWVPFLAGSVAGFVMMDKAQKKYNGSWYS